MQRPSIDASLSAVMPRQGRSQALGRVLVPVLALLAAAGLVRAETPDSCRVIKSIEVRGNNRMSADAVRFDLAIKPGATWDDVAVHREYQRFWKRGYFSDLRFLRRCDPDGAVLVIEMKERPTLLSVTYDKSKDINQTQIEDYYKQREFTLQVGTPLDMRKIWRARALIKEVLEQKGYQNAEVVAEVKETSTTTRSVRFKIKSGGKTRIRKLDFTGNKVFSDRTLRRQLKMTSAWRWYWPFGSKSVYHPLKYQQDANNILQYYKDHGYLDADLRPPVVTIRPVDPEKAQKRAVARAEKQARKNERQLAKLEKKGQAPPRDVDLTAKPEPDVRVRSWAFVTVPVDEGPAYKLGSVKFEGNTIFKSDLLRAFVPIRDGAVISDAALEAGISQIRALYGTRGYVYAAVTRRFERQEDAKTPTADVVVQVEEDQAYTVRRIEFRGNTSTNDEVLRRELNVYEGELLNKAQLDRSMTKLHQLGYWMPGEEPTLEPVKDKAEVDVRVQGEEQSHNEVQVGGGYSELEGGFFMASYQTRNFLGRGEQLDLQLSVGGRSSRAVLGFTEPWFLGKPNTLGFQIYRRNYDYGLYSNASGQQQRLSQTGTGGSITIGRRLGDFTLIQLTYGYESVSADTLDLSSQFASTRTKIASLSPVFSYKRVNNYLRPTHGFEFSLVPQIAFKALGGDNDYYRPRVSTSIYHPVFTRFFVAAHLEGQYIHPFGSLDRRPGYIDGVPRFERFYLGGDTIGPRVFETRTISPTRTVVQVDQFGHPIDANGNIVDPATGGIPAVISGVYVGGNKALLGQFELGFPIGKTATIAGFFDAGGVYDDGERINGTNLRMSTGLEFRVFIPVFQAPIRLIYGWPLRKLDTDRISRFQFSIGLPF